MVCSWRSFSFRPFPEQCARALGTQVQRNLFGADVVVDALHQQTDHASLLARGQCLPRPVEQVPSLGETLYRHPDVLVGQAVKLLEHETLDLRSRDRPGRTADIAAPVIAVALRAVLGRMRRTHAAAARNAVE